MKSIGLIVDAYLRVEGSLDAEMVGAQGRTLASIELRQKLNDQAYFLLGWGQLELAIDERCREAIRRRRADRDWKVRRAWDLYNPEDNRLSGLSFENRARLVLDQSEGRGSPFALALAHYSLRNQVAHGRFESTRIDVSAFVRDCYLIQAALHRAS